MTPEDREWGVTSERDFACKQLVEQAAKGIDVRTRISPFPVSLLGRHVEGGAHHDTRRGHRAEHLTAGYPEVRDLRDSLWRQQDVLRL